MAKKIQNHSNVTKTKSSIVPRFNLEQCVKNLKNFEEKELGKDFDKAAEDLRLATRYLGMIVGKVDVEEILGSIFSDFCIGK